MSAGLAQQLEAEELAAAAAAAGAVPPDADAAAEADADVDRVEKRRAYDRERKRRERESRGAKKRKRAEAPDSGPSDPAKPRPEPKAKRGKVEKELDPRVALAVQMCLESMIVKEVTPEFAEKMNAAMMGAIAYEIEVRLPLIAEEFEPEIGLGCAVIGSGVTRFRLARYLARKKAEEGVVVREVPNQPPPAPAAAPTGDAAS